MNRTVIALTMLVFGVHLCAQTDINVDLPGQSYTNTDGVVVDNYSGIDISSCSSISFSVSFSFSLPWEGPGNMESADECIIPPCAGDPTDPSGGGCDVCWDFMWMQFYIDGSEVDMNLIGEAGTTDSEQFGIYESPIFCTDGASTAEINISNQNWAASETNTFSNVIIICYEGVPEITTNDPICGNADLNLDGSTQDASVVSNWEWTNDGAGAIDNSSSQNTFSVGAEDGEEYVLTTTDINGCDASSAVMVSIGPSIDAAIGGGGDLCANTCTDIDTDVFFLISGGDEPYTINLNVNGFPIPALAIDLDETVRVCHDDGIILPGIDFGTDPIEVSIPTGFFPIDIALISVMDDSGCSATIDPANNSINLILLDPPSIAEPVPPSYCADSDGIIDLTVMNDQITDGDNSLDVFWYLDMELNDEISNPSTYNFNDGLTVYAIVHDGECPSEPIEIDLTVFQYPVIDVFDGIVDCAFPFELPDIEDFANLDNTNNPLYYLDMALSNGPFASGSFIDPTGIDQLFIFDSNGPCETLVSVAFDVSVPPEIISPIGTLGGCGTIVLPIPEIEGTFISYEYNTEEDGSGESFDDGDLINSADNIETIYLIVYAENDCQSVEELEVSLENLIEYQAAIPTTSCNFLVLPPISPNTGSVAYYTMSAAGGLLLLPGDTLFGNPGAIVVHELFISDPAQDSDCAPELMVSTSIADSPVLVVPSDTVICGVYIIDSLMGIFSMQASYASDTFIDPATALVAGDTIFNSQTIYLIDTIGICTFLDSFSVDLLTTPNIGMDTSLQICEGFDLFTLDFMNLIGNPDPGGVWSHPIIPDFELLDSTNVDLSLLVEGSYVFSYTIEDSCDIYTSNIVMEVTELPFVGNSAVVNLCSSNDVYDFMSFLGNPDEGGFWNQTSGPSTIQLFDSTTVDFIGDMPGTYSFEYVLKAEGNLVLCIDQQSTLEIILTEGPNAGVSLNSTICLGETVDISQFLSGDADDNGVYEPNGFLLSGTTWNTTGFVPNQNYFIDYIVPSGSPNCPNDTATITIYLTDNISAGLANGLGPVCENTAVNLEDYIDGESPGGTFVLTDNQSTEISSPWIADASTQFDYIIQGAPGCDGDTSSFMVQVIPIPVVGISLSNTFICSPVNNCTSLNINSIQLIEIGFELLNVNSGEIYSYTGFISGSFSLQLCAGNNFGDISYDGDTIYIGTTPGQFIINPEYITDNTTNCSVNLTSAADYVFDFLEDYEITLSETVCEGEPYNYNGQDFFQSEDLIFLSSNGCDSIIHIVIDNYPQQTGIVSGNYCDGDVVTIFGNDYLDDTMTTLIVDNAASNGCDTIIDIDLVFESVINSSVAMTLCSTESLTVEGIVFDLSNPNGVVDVPGGSVNGCDSTVTVQLSFYNEATAMLVQSICEGESVVIGGDVYDMNQLSGTSILANQSAGGCDSIVSVDLSLIPISENIIEAQLCAGETMVINNTIYDQDNSSGIEVLPNAASSGCDSIIMITLRFDIPDAQISADEICPEEINSIISITNLQSLSLPVDIIVNGIDQGTFNNIPIEVNGNPGLNTVEIISANCNHQEDITISSVDTSNISVSNNSLGNNQYLLGINSTFLPQSIIWSPDNTLSCNNCDNPVATISQNTQLSVEITHPSGCVFERQVSLQYNEVVHYYIPNIIDLTDPSNQIFYIGSNNDDAIILEFLIYDRWGNLVFQGENVPVNDSSIGWNGTKDDDFVEQGVYVYVLTVLNSEGESEIIAGDLTLLR